MAIDKLIPQYLNSDTDQKLVKSVEMTDNLNVRISNDDDGNAGVLKNVKGNISIPHRTGTDIVPTGDNRVIGSIANEKKREVIFLLWNSNSNHGIYRIDLTINKFEKLYEDSVLNFRRYSYVDCDIVMNEDDETLLYWTDNINPPCKVNIDRLIRSDYPSSLYNGTDEEKLLSLTVAKQPPLFAPTFNIVNNPSVKYNNISDKVFQFAYRYTYVDGEVSALSEYSTTTASVAQLKDGIVDQSSLDFFNQVDVFVRNSVGDVKEITLFAREGTEGLFYEVDKRDNNNTTNTSKIEFRNDKLTSALSVDDVNKTYDNVPQQAAAQAIVGGRLMYGNYREGYANVNIDVSPDTVYREKPEMYTIVEKINPTSSGSTPYRTVTTNSSTDFDIGFDFSDLPATLPAGSVVHIDSNIVVQTLEVTDAATNYPSFIVGYRIPKALDGNIKDVFDSETIDERTYSFPTEGIRIREEIKFTNATTRASAISTIANRLADGKYMSVIDADSSNPNQATALSNKSNAWFAGVAYFKLEKSSLINNNNTQVFNLHFGGADVHVKALTVEKSVSESGLISALTGNFELPVDVASSPTLSIGGMSGYNTNSGTLTETAKFEVAAFAGNSSYMAESIDGHKSFKTDTDHKFGIVYFDDRGRYGGVNKIDPVYVEGLSERDQKLSTAIDFRIKSNPPSWARKWQLVYAGNTKYDKFLQYTASGALPSKEAMDDRIYVSMRSLEGKPQSYKENSGARLEYKYQEGDIAKIVRYYDESTGEYVYPTDYEFEVLGYEFVSDEKDTPFIVKHSFEKGRTGWFLVLRSRDLGNFDYENVLAGEDDWSEKVLLEIYSKKKETEESVYYGMGKMYDVLSKRHYGDRSVTSSTSITATVNGGLGYITSSDRMYVGDKIVLGGSALQITDVYIQVDGTFRYSYAGTATTGTFTSSVSNYDEAVVTTKQGDVYFRMRKLKKSNTFYDEYFLDERFENNSFAYDLDYIEDVSVSDFFKSDSTTKGKPFAYLPEAKTVHRKASITYSDPFVIDSDRLSLSSFNLSLSNWTDLDILHGSVHAMINRGDALTVIQESKACQIPVSRNILEYSSGDAGVTVSRNVLSLPSYYAGDFGTTCPESVVNRFGVVYFVDVNAGKVIRLSGDGITLISEQGMDSFFEKKFRELLKISKKIIAVGGFDPRNNEYLITIEPVYNASLTIGTDLGDIPVDVDASFVINGMVFTSQTVLWNIWGNVWNTYCGDWDDVGNGVVFVDSAFNVQGILVDSAFINSTATIDILITDSGYTFSAIGTLDLSTGTVVMPQTTCEGTAITIGDAEEKEEGFTISYKHKDGVWGSKYSFTPTNYVYVNNDMYSFFDNTDNKLVWQHDENDARNNFYNVQYDSMFEVVSNKNPSMVKVYEAVGIEGSGTWSATMTTEDQSTNLVTSDFDTREGNSYANIPRDTLVSKSHQIYLGRVDSVSGDKVTFTTPVNRLPFVVGDILKTASGSTLTGTGAEISNIDGRKTIQCTAAISNISAGDDIFVEHEARIDGDPMRGVFLKTKLTSSDTNAFEVHALSLSYDRSRLHNDRVN